MSTGAEHYRQAEAWLERAPQAPDEHAAQLAAATALVHAQLAQAAATADLALVTLAAAPVHTGTVDRTVVARRLAFGKAAT